MSAVWLDIVGSLVFGTLLALNVMRMDADVTAHSYRSLMTYSAQDQAASVSEVMDDDLKKIGYRVASVPVILADTTRIQFRADLGTDGTVDTLFYYLGTIAEANGTPNPRDRFLYRRRSGESPRVVGTGVTNFRLTYFGANGNVLSLPVVLANVRRIQVDMTLESPAPYDTTYSRALMQLSLRPKNLGL
jgi:hypothetical protein